MKTLLQIVQDILSDLDSDSVNSIGDTVESQQVASIVRSTYEELLANRNWPHTRKLSQLVASNDTTKPNYLKFPDALKSLCYIEYETQKLGDSKVVLTELVYRQPDDFLRFIAQRDSTKTNIQTVVDFSGVKLLIQNDKAPQYWTSFDDKWVVTDSYDSAVDNTLKQSKSRCLAYFTPSWTHEDEFIPDLPQEAFPALVEEAKSTAFIVIKQSPNQKVEQKAARQHRWLSNNAWRADGRIEYPHYGRK